jgi:hypothetical protein
MLEQTRKLGVKTDRVLRGCGVITGIVSVRETLFLKEVGTASRQVILNVKGKQT